MDIRIYPQKLSGTVHAIPSKSQAHRLLICAAFADAATRITCPETNQDIEATAGCLNALGADIRRTDTGYLVTPVQTIPKRAALYCKESGSTLRFMLPVAGALGVDATFHLEGRLPQRPLSPLWEEMERMGCHLTKPGKNTIHCTGRLHAGCYTISGGVSSQFITGLLFAMSLIQGNSTLSITGKLESSPYVDMTRQVLKIFGVNAQENHISGSYPFSTPREISVEGDWSNGAFFLAAKAMGNPLTVVGLHPDSAQGDRKVTEALSALRENTAISAADIPDLIPILAVFAGCKQGATFTDIARLRLKESDRVASVAAMLKNLGADVAITENTLTVAPAPFKGCTIDAVQDHRIAMAAAIAATVAQGPVTIIGAECVKKSYPSFWDEYRRLGGNYEQYLR